MVYGLNKDGEPLMPTERHGKVRRMLKNTRIHLGLEKSHVNDAYCIAGNLSAKPLETVLIQRKVRRNNRQMFKANTLRGGVRKRNQAPYIVKGLRLFDKVRFRGKICFVTGRRASGYFALRTMDGAKVHDSAKAADIVLLEMRKGCIQERGMRQFLPAL